MIHTVVRCDKCREYKAVLSGAPGKREIQRELKRQGWKMTDTGHYCGMGAGWKLGTS